MAMLAQLPTPPTEYGPLWWLIGVLILGFAVAGVAVGNWFKSQYEAQVAQNRLVADEQIASLRAAQNAFQSLARDMSAMCGTHESLRVDFHSFRSLVLDSAEDCLELARTMAKSIADPTLRGDLCQQLDKLSTQLRRQDGPAHR